MAECCASGCCEVCSPGRNDWQTYEQGSNQTDGAATELRHGTELRCGQHRSNGSNRAGVVRVDLPPHERIRLRLAAMEAGEYSVIELVSDLEALRDERDDLSHRLGNANRLYRMARAAANRRVTVPVTSTMVTALQKIAYGTWDGPEQVRRVAADAHKAYVDWTQQPHDAGPESVGGDDAR